jgi:hypothetical protein
VAAVADLAASRAAAAVGYRPAAVTVPPVAAAVDANSLKIHQIDELKAATGVTLSSSWIPILRMTRAYAALSISTSALSGTSLTSTTLDTTVDGTAYLFPCWQLAY